LSPVYRTANILFFNDLALAFGLHVNEREVENASIRATGLLVKVLLEHCSSRRGTVHDKGISSVTTKSRLLRARRILRQVLN
jgi:hypothetical protein